MSDITQDTLDLRQRGMEMLSSLEDHELLKRVVDLIHDSYMEEVVGYERNGKPVTRAGLYESFRKGVEEMESGKAITGEEMVRRMKERFGNR